jgi:hypothetical protein
MNLSSFLRRLGSRAPAGAAVDDVRGGVLRRLLASGIAVGAAACAPTHQPAQAQVFDGRASLVGRQLDSQDTGPSRSRQILLIVTHEGQQLVLDRSGARERATLSGDSLPMELTLQESVGTGGDLVFRTTEGQVILRVNDRGGGTLFLPPDHRGQPVDVGGR